MRPGFSTPGAGVRDIFNANPAKVRACTEPVKYHGYGAIKKDIDALEKALSGKGDVDGFLARSGR